MKDDKLNKINANNNMMVNSMKNTENNIKANSKNDSNDFTNSVYYDICKDLKNNIFDYQSIINYDNGLKLLYSGLDELGITINEKQQKQLLSYYVMLVEKNKVMNLTGITEFEEVVVKHFIDSLALIKVVDGNKLMQSMKVIDIGTGAGFPGIPLKIVYPNMEITLLDSLAKRLKFLEEVIDVLGLENISTLHGRCEDLGKNKQYREVYDMCVSRAVANLSTLSEFCIPFIKVGGEFIAYKAGNSNDLGIITTFRA